MLSRKKHDNHLIKHLELAADVYHVGARVVEHTVLRYRVFDQVRMVHALPHVHQTTLHAKVLLIALEPLHLHCVGGGWPLSPGDGRDILLHLGNMLLKLFVIQFIIIGVIQEGGIVDDSLLPLLRKYLFFIRVFRN